MCLAPVVVVGAGQAGAQAAITLRERGHRGPVTVVGAEEAAPYQRPPLTKGYLAGAAGPADVLLRPPTFYAERGIDLWTGDPVVELDRVARRVTARSGRQVAYRHLVLATGSRPRRLDVPGADLDGVCTLRTITDADDIRSRLAAGLGQRLVVIGAGFVGLELAAVAAAAGHRVTVVEATSRVLARGVSAGTAEYVAAAHRAAGVRILLDTGVSALHPGPAGRVAAVETATGAVLPADLVVAGIGVRPETTLAEAAGLAVADGIVVDEYLLTADRAVSAIGDCARARGPRGGQPVRLESVQNAVDQAVCLATGLCGPPHRYTALPWFWSDQGPLRLQIAGLADRYDRSVPVGDPATGRFSVYLFRGARLLAVESVNRPLDHVLARRMLAAGGQPTPAEVAAPGFELRAHIPAAA